MDVAAIKGIELLGPSGLRSLAQAANSLGIIPDWLAAPIGFESHFNPAARNPTSNATGLIQFMPGPNGSAVALGTTVDDLARMSVSQQMFYVVKYLSPFKPFKDMESVYLSIFYPKARNMADDDIVARQGEKVYEQNIVFDPPRDGVRKGYFTRRDITAPVRALLSNATTKPRITIPGVDPFLAGPSLEGSPIGGGLNQGAEGHFLPEERPTLDDVDLIIDNTHVIPGGDDT